MPFARALAGNQSVSWNFLGNVTGRLWLAVLSVATVPVFVHLLGTEAFGLVALVATLQSVLALFDLGLAGTVNREVATMRRPESRAQIADVLRTFEFIYWAVGLGIGLGIAGLSSWIANSWLTSQTLPPSDIRVAIILGGIALAARWPVALYTGVLQGFERQVLHNAILIAAATTRVALTLVALLFISRTVYGYLISLAVGNALEVVLTGAVARRLVDAAGGGTFSFSVLRRVWRFAVGFNLVGAFGSLVSGTDKLLISKLLPLVDLTYYSVAGTATGALQFVYIAAQASLFPRIAASVQQDDLAQVRRLYYSGLRITVYLCTGPAVLLVCYSSEIVALWTRSPTLTEHVRLLLPILALATLANAAVAAPLNAILAAGRTLFPLLVNTVSLPIMAAGCYLAVRDYGVIGAATCWLAWNLISFAVYARYCRMTLLAGGAQPGLWGLPLGVLLVGGVTGFSSRVLMPSQPGTLVTLCWLLVTLLGTYSGGLSMLQREDRSLVLAPLRRLRSRLQGGP